MHVTVVTPDGTSTTSAADQFTYVAAPTVSGVDPPVGNASGGDIVTISGTNLDGALAVDFGQNAGSIIYDSPNLIQAVSPAGSSGVIDVTVVAPGGTSPTLPADQFTYVGAPVGIGDEYTVATNAVLSVPAPGVLANDADPQSLPLTATLLAEPANGTLSFNSDGSFTYSPNNGYVGPDNFVYQASNGYFTSDPTVVSITVTPVTLVVTKTADSGPGSLRQAVLDADNGLGVPATIQFELPAGPQTIDLMTPLPTVTVPVTVSLDVTQNVTVQSPSGSAWQNANSTHAGRRRHADHCGGHRRPWQSGRQCRQQSDRRRHCARVIGHRRHGQ